MKKYEQYKDSGVAWIGDIPSHWRVCKTKYIANLFTGNSLNDSQKEEYSISASDSTLPYVATKDITAENDTINYSNGINIPKNSLLKVAPENTFLLCVEGGSAGRKIAYNTSPAYFVNKLCCFESKINPRYHYYFVKSHGFANIFKQSIQGLIGGVSVSTLNNLEIAIPSMEEQQAIVRFLDYKVAKIDQLIAESEVQIEELGKYKTAMISEVVTKGLNPDAPMRDSGIEWIGQIPEHWETIKLKYYTSKIGSGVTPTGGAEVYQENGVIFLRSQNIHNDGLRLEDAAYISDEIDQQMSNSRVCFGDVLLNITGASIGRCHCFDRNIRANVNQHVCIIRPDASKLNCKYLQYILNSDMGQILIKLGESGANREGLTFEQIKNFVIPICDISEQKQIVDVIVAKSNSINQTIDSLKQNVACLAQYKASLISEAVTGQIDVRDWHEK